MTTYATYKCDTCRRTTEIEVDPQRPSYNHCTITFKCNGRLQMVGTKNVRSQLLTAPVTGLTNWKPRTEASKVVENAVNNQQIPITTGINTLTVAVSSLTALPDVLNMNCEVEQKTVKPFRQYTYTNFATPTSRISGPDSTTDKKILRFSTALPFPDALKVTLNGVDLKKGTKAAGFANVIAGSVVSVTITQPGSGYDVPPVVTFGGTGSGAAGTATIVNGSVTGVTITASGINYTGQVPISFSAGVANKTLYYTGYNEFELEPPISVGSKLDVIVVPYVEPSSVQLTFKKHSLDNLDGSWANVTKISSGKEYVLFSCTEVDKLDDGVHLVPSNLIAQSAEIAPSNWVFLVSADPHENSDRLYAAALKPQNANLFKTVNILNQKDILIDSATLTSVYPPFSIVERLTKDTLEGRVSQLNPVTYNNSFIIGLSQ